MIKKIVSPLIPHLSAIIVFIVISSVYFSPVFEGKTLDQSDMRGYYGMSKEIRDFREKTGIDPLWTNSMFGGMPAYLISMKQPGQILSKINGLLTSYPTRPVCFVVLYMLGFYILLQLFSFNVWLSIAGGIAYGFSSYFFIILEPGHITKAMALGYMPMVIGAAYYIYHRNSIFGVVFFSLFFGLQLLTNHLQIVYYTCLVLVFFSVFEFIKSYSEKKLPKFFKATALLMAAAVLSVGMNFTGLWTVYEYSKYSMRGPSDLKSDSEDRTKGLDRSYVTAWSYSKGETFNLLIPNFKGGSSGQFFDKDSNIYKHLVSKYGPQNALSFISANPGIFTQYWGSQPGTSGPVYIGASLIFIFILGMYLLKGPFKWWLFSITSFAILLAWGGHFKFLTDLFLDYFPMYNKFRTVSMILVIAEFAIPLLAIYTIHKIISENFSPPVFKKAIIYALSITGGICLLFAIAPRIADLNGPYDDLLSSQGYGDWVSKLKSDRAALLSKDAFRSLVIILITSGLLYLQWSKKIKLSTFYILLPLLFLIDLWPVNKRYLNDDNFVPKRNMDNPYTPTEADKAILNDSDLYFRVFDLSVGNPFSSSRASYFHKSVGGYHGAKIRRYQDLIEKYISKGNDTILDMLNTKYLIQNDPSRKVPLAVVRPSALGNAWFVSETKIVENADEEINSLKNFNPRHTAIIDKTFENELTSKTFVTDSSDYIKLVSYAPNNLRYEYKTSRDQLTVFSEIYYPAGWKLFIDGTVMPHFRANYILRAAILPSGKHQAEFIFKPRSYFTGIKIALISTIILILVTGGALLMLIKKKDLF